jgi:hypothetical protein
MPEEEHRLRLRVMMHVNAYMLFVVYYVIFQHIYILSTLKIMFYMDFGDFQEDPLYFGSNPIS